MRSHTPRHRVGSPEGSHKWCYLRLFLKLLPSSRWPTKPKTWRLQQCRSRRSRTNKPRVPWLQGFLVPTWVVVQVLSLRKWRPRIGNLGYGRFRWIIVGVIALPEGVSVDGLMGRTVSCDRQVWERRTSDGLIGTLNPFREIGRSVIKYDKDSGG